MRIFTALIIFGLIILIQGCANPNTIRLGKGQVRYLEPKLVEPDKYLLVASGAAANTKIEVVKAFHLKAKVVCAGNIYESSYETEPFTYGRSVGGVNHSYAAFRVTGTVTCKPDFSPD